MFSFCGNVFHFSFHTAQTAWSAARCRSRFWWLIVLAFGHFVVSVPPFAYAEPHTWNFTGSLGTVSSAHTATLLPTGQVLVVGGSGLASAELYDPTTGTWSETGSLSTGRSKHTATLLPTGQVLVTGGININGTLASAELYDPVTGAWSETGNLNTTRAFHAATLLPNGRVLVMGGRPQSDSGYSTDSAELYDPMTGTWSETGNLTIERFNHTVTLLPNGQPLAVGGRGGQGIDSSELYDLATGMWTLIWSGENRGDHTATLLLNGQVLAAGGTAYDYADNDSAELFDPATETWRNTGYLNHSRADHDAALLPDGQVLVMGGYQKYVGIIDSAEVYNPITETWSETDSMGTPRVDHTATALSNGQVLITGGRNSDGALASAELYDPGDRENVVQIKIDIKPGKYPNLIQPSSQGKLPVAILSTPDFVAAAVDADTVLFGATGTEAAPIKSALRDLDRDGDRDLILLFHIEETNISCGDEFASLTGETVDGQSIVGSDSIITVGCRP